MISAYDLLAREVFHQKQEVIKEVVASFGQASIFKEKFNPTLLAKVVFQNKENVKKMNVISHPRIQKLSIEKIENFIKKMKKSKSFTMLLY